MEMSVREARAQFATALAAAARGERVTITRNGTPVAELGPPPVAVPKRTGIDWDRVAAASRKAGIVKPDYPLDDAWLERFNDPAWGRELFGLDRDDDEDKHLGRESDKQQ